MSVLSSRADVSGSRLSTANPKRSDTRCGCRQTGIAKFVFQGGGGVDGVLRLALGVIGFGTPQPNGLSAGHAAVSTDAGHLEESGPIGPYLFGLNPQARADKG
jgi:hypothetical protein